jgi:hypothetical protein
MKDMHESHDVSNANAPITFSVGEAARIAEIDCQLLRNWINVGIITPAIRGGRGRGKGHRFSVPQLFQICIGAYLSEKEWGQKAIKDVMTGGYQRYVKSMMSEFSHHTYGDILHMFDIHRDDITEERYVKLMQRLGWNDEAEGNALTPEEKERYQQEKERYRPYARRMERFVEAIKERLRLRKNRITQTNNSEEIVLDESEGEGVE